jgi:hypothetical protein
MMNRKRAPAPVKREPERIRQTAAERQRRVLEAAERRQERIFVAVAYKAHP